MVEDWRAKCRGWQTTLKAAYKHANRETQDEPVYRDRQSLEVALLAGRTFIFHGASDGTRRVSLICTGSAFAVLLLLTLGLSQTLPLSKFGAFATLVWGIASCILVAAVLHVNRFLAVGQGGILRRGIGRARFLPWTVMTKVVGEQVTSTWRYSGSSVPVRQASWPRITLHLKSGGTWIVEGLNYDLSTFPGSRNRPRHPPAAAFQETQSSSDPGLSSLFFDLFYYYWERASKYGLPDPPVKRVQETTFVTHAPAPAAKQVKPPATTTTPFLAEVREEGGCILVTADLPGIEARDVQVEVEGRELSITAGKYGRVIHLPAPVLDRGVKGRYSNGVLELRLEKK